MHDKNEITACRQSSSIKNINMKKPLALLCPNIRKVCHPVPLKLSNACTFFFLQESLFMGEMYLAISYPVIIRQSQLCSFHSFWWAAAGRGLLFTRQARKCPLLIFLFLGKKETQAPVRSTHPLMMVLTVMAKPAYQFIL